ncbi:MAG: hypothetical protein D3925_05455 [Candidatus Electrothrix sp. AR5]|nr:hypothetical protein [Candidatus Electrothrix sp. AR5]
MFFAAKKIFRPTTSGLSGLILRLCYPNRPKEEFKIFFQAFHSAPAEHFSTTFLEKLTILALVILSFIPSSIQKNSSIFQHLPLLGMKKKKTQISGKTQLRHLT